MCPGSLDCGKAHAVTHRHAALRFCQFDTLTVESRQTISPSRTTDFPRSSSTMAAFSELKDLNSFPFRDTSRQPPELVDRPNLRWRPAAIWAMEMTSPPK